MIHVCGESAFRSYLPEGFFRTAGRRHLAAGLCLPGPYLKPCSCEHIDGTKAACIGFSSCTTVDHCFSRPRTRRGRLRAGSLVWPHASASRPRKLEESRVACVCLMGRSACLEPLDEASHSLHQPLRSSSQAPPQQRRADLRLGTADQVASDRPPAPLREMCAVDWLPKAVCSEFEIAAEANPRSLWHLAPARNIAGLLSDQSKPRGAVRLLRGPPDGYTITPIAGPPSFLLSFSPLLFSSSLSLSLSSSPPHHHRHPSSFSTFPHHLAPGYSLLL
ncbi:hypothetical protein DFH27DRAFT_161293 [Peziza echinospora]|nr:hypothetical protein DFH27DRAFT_161293 [Peziza echinospora]